MKKLVSLVLALALCMTVCSAFAAEGVAGKAYTINEAGLIEAMGWYTLDTYSLMLNEDGTYELVYRFDSFGAEDTDTRGTRLMVFKGTWTDADPEDEETGHRDVTLAAAQSIYYIQNGKINGRSGGDKVLDTKNWTDDMTNMAEMTCEEFMAAYAQEYVFVIEEPTLDDMDDTLVPQIYEMPEIAMPVLNS